MGEMKNRLRSGQKMSKPCERCKENDEHLYWDHMDDEEKYFFKVMIGDFMHRMSIPEKYVKNFKGHVSEVVELEVPNGNRCSVQVTKELNKLVLQLGWDTFCSAHDLQQGDFLVFRYGGNSSFKVLIFDQSGCQKVSSCVVRNSDPVVQEASDNSVEILGTSYDHSAQSSRTLARRWRYERRVNRMTAKVTSKDSSALKPDVRSPEGIQVPVNSGDLGTSTESRYVLSRTCNLTREQKAQLHVIEQNIRPVIPLYVTAMNKANILGTRLVICRDYAVKHLPQEDETITLCRPGSWKSWDVNFQIKPDGRRALSDGWQGFVHGNCLKEGDVCIFQLSKRKRRMAMTMRLLPETSRLQPSSSTEVEHIRKSCED